MSRTSVENAPAQPTAGCSRAQRPDERLYQRIYNSGYSDHSRPGADLQRRGAIYAGRNGSHWVAWWLRNFADYATQRRVAQRTSSNAPPPLVDPVTSSQTMSEGLDTSVPPLPQGVMVESTNDNPQFVNFGFSSVYSLPSPRSSSARAVNPEGQDWARFNQSNTGSSVFDLARSHPSSHNGRGRRVSPSGLRTEVFPEPEPEATEDDGVHGETQGNSGFFAPLTSCFGGFGKKKAASSTLDRVPAEWRYDGQAPEMMQVSGRR